MKCYLSSLAILCLSMGLLACYCFDPVPATLRFQVSHLHIKMQFNEPDYMDIAEDDLNPRLHPEHKRKRS